MQPHSHIVDGGAAMAIAAATVTHIPEILQTIAIVFGIVWYGLQIYTYFRNKAWLPKEPQ